MSSLEETELLRLKILGIRSFIDTLEARTMNAKYKVAERAAALEAAIDAILML